MFRQKYFLTKPPDELTGQTVCTMTKELVIYVTKEVYPSGFFTFSISSNKTKYKYGFSVQRKMPEMYGENVDYYESFNQPLNQLIKDSKIPIGECELKVLYNQEYKTTGWLVLRERNDIGQTYGCTGISNFVPMIESEILHFMRLFYLFGRETL